MFFIANYAYHSNLVNLPLSDEHNKHDTINEDVKISDNVELPFVEMYLEKITKMRKNEWVNKAFDLERDNGYNEDTRDTTKSDNLIDKFSKE